ncbi:MAG TPA: 1-acyl-sn-glycerol-3-phosphate acyltransferase [Syntrophothermus lipocalidus]|uniref:1-acyl-sn-glycerol-3-phosphate acyltransferase n=1 Tax=Syntrophothermus lipocalidus (strain DSM 12680 / TGB-C1) TaxID=643648 RepID=D7CNG3_SYNLT|nr:MULTISPECIES: lysophospholipid acyltransferase family protein [Syntrophothermus]ADI02248.1 1-acyl-sn-glycerol-3-phosphate acyltransferase [Syntrophothermus lipocalidus DSM 12680]NSW81948.1 1-acyl-sn-glycerol-3-phosphate acyltransferase [Syntrophothermus sp.]HHV75910.1 1-acyl-sn-glycerol-3-phosphate acyltransferase [Syntrophothermus lipocalidus]
MLYRFLRWLSRCLFFLCRWRVEGIENVPASGPVIIAANHVSNWDPVAVGAALTRTVHFMAKEEMFENQVLAKFFTAIHAFPVKRGAPDRKAIRRALELLGEGQVVGMFPEGTRSKTGELRKPQPGVAMIALKARAQIVPVACIGTRGLVPCGWRRPFIIRIGKPVEYGEYYGSRLSTQVIEDVSQDIMKRIQELLN